VELVKITVASQRSRLTGRVRQRGISLLFSLLALAALSLAGVALVQSIGTGASVIGNLGMKQDTTAASDQAVRQAITAIYAKLTSSTTSLDNNIPSMGYYATSSDDVDATGAQLTASTRLLVNWQNNCDGAPVGTCSFTPLSLANAINGNTAQYVIFRLCNSTGDPSTVTTIVCARPLVATSTSSMDKSSIDYKRTGISDSSSTPYYRIVVRVAGSRNTVSFTETIVHF
jgi:type IV pilus assembly protein PilX